MELEQPVWTLRAIALLASAAISCLAPALAVEQHQTGQPSTVPPDARIYWDLPVHIDARPSPTPVLGDDGARYLVYRVFVTNWSERDLRFQGFDVLDAESGQVLARYDTTDFADPRRQRSTLFITSDPRPENRTLATGRTAIIAVHFALDASMPEPRGFRHRVRVGQRVRRGEVIGLLGNSGNSVGPHLHFHVGDGNSLNGSEGQPYVFERFVFLGRGRPETALLGNERRNALPLEGAVLVFPDP